MDTVGDGGQNRSVSKKSKARRRKSQQKAVASRVASDEEVPHSTAITMDTVGDGGQNRSVSKKRKARRRKSQQKAVASRVASDEEVPHSTEKDRDGDTASGETLSHSGEEHRHGDGEHKVEVIVSSKTTFDELPPEDHPSTPTSGLSENLETLAATSEASEMDSHGAANVNKNGGHAARLNNDGWQVVTNIKKHRRQTTELGSARRGSQVDAAGDRSDKSSDSINKANGTSTTASASNKKPEKKKKDEKPQLSVSEAAASIDAAELAHFLLGISESLKDQPHEQLFSCAEYFILAFDLVTNDKFPWSTLLRESPVAESIDIPYSYLPGPLIETMSNWLSQKPNDVLSDFATWMLKKLFDEPQQKTGPGSSFTSTKPQVGVLVVFALLARNKPEVLAVPAAFEQELFQSPDNLRTLAWACGQAARGDLVAGMALWIQNLLPLAVGKGRNPASRDIVLQFIENVLLTNTCGKARRILINGATKHGQRLVPPAAFEALLRASFPSESAKTKTTGRFQAVYPFLQELALAGSLGSKATKRVAQQLLPMCLTAAAEDGQTLQQEAISCFVWCLTQNTDCYKQWEKLHLENLRASTRTLDRINIDWKEKAKLLTRLDDLNNTLRALSLKHQNGLKETEGDDELVSGLNAAESVTQSLLKKISRLQVVELTKVVPRNTCRFLAVAAKVTTLAFGAVVVYNSLHLSK